VDCEKCEGVGGVAVDRNGGSTVGAKTDEWVRGWTVNKHGDNGGSGVLPEGAAFCPEAERCLERALDCLRGGLTVSAWHHAEQARLLLDRVTDAPVEGGVVGNLRKPQIWHTHGQARRCANVLPCGVYCCGPGVDCCVRGFRFSDGLGSGISR
jgi:hypothetical protein